MCNSCFACRHPRGGQATGSSNMASRSVVVLAALVLTTRLMPAGPQPRVAVSITVAPPGSAGLRASGLS
jgi:hypothetical protein